MNEEIIKSSCPGCGEKTDFLFCWPKLVLGVDGANDWVCFVCASKQLGDILAENKRLKAILIENNLIGPTGTPGPKGPEGNLPQGSEKKE